MAFGLSGSTQRTQMFGSDVTVAWIDADTGSIPNAEDYYLSGYQQVSAMANLKQRRTLQHHHFWTQNTRDIKHK